VQFRVVLSSAANQQIACHSASKRQIDSLCCYFMSNYGIKWFA